LPQGTGRRDRIQAAARHRVREWKMEFWWTMLVGSLLLLGFFGWRRFEWMNLQQAERVPWTPTERVSGDQLFGYLLSGNLALMAHDDFNQLASALPPPRIRRILVEQWSLKSAIECRRRVEYWLVTLGMPEPGEQEAWAAWRERRPIDSDAYRALRAGAHLLRVDAGTAATLAIDPRQFSMMAWDVQQAAYVVRLGFAVGYLSRAMAESTLARLQHAVRAHYTSWADYSLSALLGMGLRGRFDGVEWHCAARSHERLLVAHAGLLHRAPFGKRPPATRAMRPEARVAAAPE
jgi:hypothetical protein